MVFTELTQMNKLTIVEFHQRLKDLLYDPPSGTRSLDDWYMQAGELVTLLRMAPDLADMVPIRVWQFLSDADLREKDPQYADAQRTLITIFVQGLAKGVVLPAEEIDKQLALKGETTQQGNRPE